MAEKQRYKLRRLKWTGHNKKILEKGPFNWRGVATMLPNETRERGLGFQN
jgi:hypothetical protein